MNRFIYIHGWGSSGSGETAELFKSLLPGLIAPSLNYYDPCGALADLLTLVDSFDKTDDIYIIASSHGGYFAELVANKRIVNVVFYNPSLSPVRVQHLLGTTLPIYDYPELQLPEKPTGSSVRCAVLCTDDDVIPLATTARYLQGYTIYPASGGHRMTATNAQLIIRIVNRLINSI